MQSVETVAFRERARSTTHQLPVELVYCFGHSTEHKTSTDATHVVGQRQRMFSFMHVLNETVVCF